MEHKRNKYFHHRLRFYSQKKLVQEYSKQVENFTEFPEGRSVRDTLKKAENHLRKSRSLKTKSSLKQNIIMNKSACKQSFSSRQYKISNNKKSFQEDALKIQNLVTGGYDDDQERYLSLSKFNKIKDDFVLLNQFYQQAKKNSNKNKGNKLKSRNIFSVIYLNQNLKKIPLKQTKEVFNRLQIVR